MKRKEAGVYKVVPNAASGFDDAAMYADFIASTPTVDREDEIIHPEDFNVEEWKSNPVWLWAHDKSAPPIGAGYKSDGTPALVQSNAALILGCKFSQANPQGALTYALYKEGTLKMVSVGFLNTETKQVAGKTYGHPRPVTRIMDPELVECSCVPIGMNRSAMLLSIKGKSWDGYVDRVGLASVLSKGHIHGEKVPEAMRRDLEPFADKLQPWAAKILVGNKIPKFSSQPPGKGLALSKDTRVPAVASIATKAPLKAGTIPPKVSEKQAPPEVTTQEVQLSVGAQTMKAMMDAALGLAKGGMEMINQSDNPEIKEAVAKYASYFATGVKQMYGDALKYFPDNKDLFTEPATLAAQYERLEENPDAARANTEEEAKMSDEVKAEETTGSTAEEGTEPKDDDTDKDEKAVGQVVTKAEMADWYAKAFGEQTPKEMIESLLQPLQEKIAELEEKLELVSDIAVQVAS